MSDYGRFDRYGLPDSFDNWLTTPPDYDEPEESEEEMEIDQTYYEVLYDEKENQVWIGIVSLYPSEFENENYPSTYATEEEAQRELERAVNEGWEVLE